jgi:hypothetical protein
MGESGACGQPAVQPSGELRVEGTLNDAVGLHPPALTSIDVSALEAREAPWRDAALAALGQPAGRAGCLGLAMANQGGARHTLVVLVTKYHLGWMAYADADHGYLTVDWNWLLDTTRSGSGWPTRAGSWPHEIGHLFHAPMKGHAQLRRRRMARSVVLMDFIRHRGRRLPRPAAGSTEPYD